MFLKNLFGAKSSQTEQTHYDRITFQINLKDNVPQFQECSLQQVQVEEEEITPSHPLYYQIFPKQQIKYVEYVTNENDTIFGLAIKLQINQNVIKELNNLSGTLYSGMTIKLPEGTDLSKLEQVPTEISEKLRISQLLKPHERSLEFSSTKYQVSYYAGLSGYIKGTITINSNYLIFNPSLEDEENMNKFTIQRLLKFNAIVETVDIQDICFLQIPEMGETEEPSVISIIQIMLYRVGNDKIQKKYKERLKQLKLDHKAIASVTFSVCKCNEKDIKQIAQEIVSKVKEIIKEAEVRDNLGEYKNRMTNIPFFDIIHQNISPKQEEVKQEQPSKVIKQSAILGCLLEESAVITDQQFNHLVGQLPVLYQLYNWTRVYNSTKDGCSFNTLLKKSKNIQPALFLVKQYKGYKFGAFLIQNLETGKTGRGEMFIFTYKDSEKPIIYRWTGKNQSFVFCSKETGIGIGMGFKYGIFIKSDLDKGSCSSTLTFGNSEMLSKKEDFLVDEIQIWGTDSSY